LKLLSLTAHSQPGSEDSDSEEDTDYKPLEEDWKKVILFPFIQTRNHLTCYVYDWIDRSLD